MGCESGQRPLAPNGKPPSTGHAKGLIYLEDTVI